MRQCSRCGREIQFVRLGSGQRVAVNPGKVPVAIGTDNGGISMGRVLHWATCEAEKDGLKRVVREM